MAKGDVDARCIVDTGTSDVVSYHVDLHLWDECTETEWGDLKTAANVSQGAFDIEAATVWSWYDNQATVFKGRLRKSFRSL